MWRVNLAAMLIQFALSLFRRNVSDFWHEVYCPQKLIMHMKKILQKRERRVWQANPE
jgi:hypothetical protein